MTSKSVIIRMKSDEVTEVLVYDLIGRDFFGEGINAKDFRAQLKAVKTKTINLRINSPGGSVTESAAMLAALDEHPARIEIDVDGLAASAASVLLMAGDLIRAASNSLIMIHNPHTFAIGDASEMRRTADLLEKVRGQIVDAYMRKAKADRSQVEKWMDDETWFTGPEAVEAGLADEATVPVSIAALASLGAAAEKLKFKHAPVVELAGQAAMEETRKRREIAAQLISSPPT